MINSFKGGHAFLSNFFKLTYPIHWRGINYPTVEHFYQAMKSLDYNTRVQIANCPTAGKSKKMGRLTPFRNDWDIVKNPIMELGVLLKFTMNVDLADKLLSTENKMLIEGNYWHDNYWGNCYCAKCAGIPGRDQLGTTLMLTRDKLKLIC